MFQVTSSVTQSLKLHLRSSKLEKATHACPCFNCGYPVTHGCQKWQHSERRNGECSSFPPYHLTLPHLFGCHKLSETSAHTPRLEHMIKFTSPHWWVQDLSIVHLMLLASAHNHKFSTHKYYSRCTYSWVHDLMFVVTHHHIQSFSVSVCTYHPTHLYYLGLHSLIVLTREFEYKWVLSQVSTDLCS